MKKGGNEYLTKTEAAQHAGISPNTLLRLLRLKRLKRYKRPGDRHVLIRRDELEAVCQPRELAS